MFVAHPAFDPAVITRSSVPAAALCRWVRATDQYHRAKKVRGMTCVGGLVPKQATLMERPVGIPVPRPPQSLPLTSDPSSHLPPADGRP